MLHSRHTDPRTAWSHRTWEDFATTPASATRIAILPPHGIGDHGLGLPLRLEEAISEPLIAAAVAGIDPAEVCVLPALQQVLGPYASCCFGVDPDTAHALLLEVGAGVHAAGFRKLVLLNSSPWNVELAATAALDLRASLGLHTYVIHGSGLGLDLHPAGADRARVQAIGSTLLGVPPEAPFRDGDCADVALRPGYWNLPLPLPAPPGLAGGVIAIEAAARLRGLLGEIAGHRTPGGEAALADWRRPAEGFRAAPPPAASPRSLADLTARQLATLTASGGPANAVAIVATGAIEQHGPHLPVGVDAFLGEIWSSALSAQLPPEAAVWFAPAMLLGKSSEHRDFPGTLSLSTRTLRHALLAQARQLHAWGFRRLAVLNTHGGNSAVLTYTLREIQTTLGLRTALLTVPTAADLPAQERIHGFHAGAWETSLLLAAMPDLVRRERATSEYPARLDDPGSLRPEKAPATFAWLTSDLSRSGVMGDATAASAESGKAWLEAGAKRLAESIIGFAGSNAPA